MEFSKNHRVLILTPSSSISFVFDYYAKKIILHENEVDCSIEYDVCVVFEDTFLNGLRVKARLLVLYTGEPPLSKPYSKSYFRQFDCVVTSQKVNLPNVIINQQCLNWHIYQTDEKKEARYFTPHVPIAKSSGNSMSVIASGKSMLPGHKLRSDFLTKLRGSGFNQEIDFFGKDINPIADKSLGLDGYLFSIALENSSIPDYWTEKLSDCFLAFTVPIYYGCTNINDYFPKDSMIIIDIKNTKASMEIIEKILKDPMGEYMKRIDSIIACRVLLLDRYHLIPSVMRVFNDFDFSKLRRPTEESITIHRYASFRVHKVLLILLRLRRFVMGLIYKIFRV